VTEIARYLAASRIGHLKEPGEASKIRYDALLSLCRGFIPSLENVPVVVVYSLNKTSEVVTFSSGPTLVFDQYIGQALNTLTRILYWADDERTAFRYFAKLLAEECVLTGNADLARHAAAVHVELDRFWKLPTIASAPEKLEEVLLQELFVFAHEYCHILMNADESFAESRHRIGELLLSSSDRAPSMKQQYEQYRARYPDSTTYEDFVDACAEKERFIAKSGEALRDELSCDDFALSVLIHACKTLGRPPGLAFRAAFLCMRHIRLLNYVRAFVRQVRDGQELSAVNDRVRLLQARQHQVRGVFSLAAKAAGIKEDLAATWSEIQTLSDDHDSRLDDPLLFGFFPKVGDVVSKMTDPSMLPRSNLQACFDLAELMGWSPREDQPSFLQL
jgi:hypothetical protein